MCPLPDGMSAIFHQYLAHPAPVSGGAEELLTHVNHPEFHSVALHPGSRSSWRLEPTSMDGGAWEGVQPAGRAEALDSPTDAQHPHPPQHTGLWAQPRTRILAQRRLPVVPSIPTFNFLIDGEAAPGSLLLLLQGLLAGRQVLDVGHVRQGVVTPVHITRESTIFTLYNISMGPNTHRGGNCTPANQAKYSGRRHSAATNRPLPTVPAATALSNSFLIKFITKHFLQVLSLL